MSIWDESGQESDKSEDYQDMLIVYRALVESMRMGQQGAKTFDNMRHQKLELKVNDLWPKLNKSAQRSIVAEFVKSGHMPQSYADILVMSNGVVNMEQPQEPCWRI